MGDFMTKQEFRALLNKGPLILDGATGSNLREMGMPVGVCTELWVNEHPEVIQKLQRDPGVLRGDKICLFQRLPAADGDIPQISNGCSHNK